MELLPLSAHAEGKLYHQSACHILAGRWNIARPSFALQHCGDDMFGDAGGQNPRRLLVCCVRLSPEKELERYIALVEQLQARGALARLGLTPLLCASATSEAAASRSHASLCVGAYFIISSLFHHCCL